MIQTARRKSIEVQTVEVWASMLFDDTRGKFYFGCGALHQGDRAGVKHRQDKRLLGLLILSVPTHKQNHENSSSNRNSA